MCDGLTIRATKPCVRVIPEIQQKTPLVVRLSVAFFSDFSEAAAEGRAGVRIENAVSDVVCGFARMRNPLRVVTTVVLGHRVSLLLKELRKVIIRNGFPADGLLPRSGNLDARTLLGQAGW